MGRIKVIDIVISFVSLPFDLVRCFVTKRALFKELSSETCLLEKCTNILGRGYAPPKFYHLHLNSIQFLL